MTDLDLNLDLDRKINNMLTLPAVKNTTTTSIIYNDGIELYKPLQINPYRFLEAYNEDVTDFVERHKQREQAMNKGGQGKDIFYLSYSHAYKIFRYTYPELEVDCVVNPLTGGFVFEEIDRRGYFIKAYVHDGERRSAVYYSAILNTLSGLGIFPDELKKKEGKELPGKYMIDAQLINKSVYRALVKAIALATGVGLKLWTGDDLNEEVEDAKLTLLSKIKALADSYKNITGNTYVEAEDLSFISTEGEIRKVAKDLQEAYKKAQEKVTSTEPGIESTPTPSKSTRKNNKNEELVVEKQGES